MGKPIDRPAQVSFLLWRCLAQCTFLGLLISAQMLGQISKGSQSDETGTLVMAGLSSSGVVISIDSAIASFDSDIDTSGRIAVDGSRKLVDVGATGACAIEGFNGNAVEGNNLGRELREWARAHPRMNAHQALSHMLKVAVASWDRGHYPLNHLPQGRKPGSPITTIICADELSDGPEILVGETSVARDGTALTGSVDRIQGDIFFEGVFTTADMFVNLVRSDILPDQLPSRFIKKYKAVGNDIRGDKSAMDALHTTLIVEDEMRSESESSFVKPFYPQSNLSQAVLKTLFTAVYKSVESSFNDVAPPNQVRLVTKCGRFATTVEGTWQVCQK
ncbi:MAG: hypothetical protein HIU91_09905 [Acidobacteria bacterium]|nr:hypothetical protein [Acidobacteriota bacterium]